ncbi:MAG: SagB/ThcOx family dehydrogenase [Bacteroidales bacterium]|nr:SagB/ThcOx family dehydrogenase [Bacteroidales bacterium]
MKSNRTLVVLLISFLPFSLFAQENLTIPLPEPEKTGGRPLMEVLNDRHSSREFSPKELSDQMLSNLLWAAFGINRPESGKRTAPSARNRQEMEIYVTSAKGLFLYDAKANALVRILSEDIRSETGAQDWVAKAAINLIYVADYSRLGDADENSKWANANASAGFIGQNVYLFCASENLATVIRGGFDREKLEPVMKLRPDQKIVLAQTVGYPKEEK